MDNKEKIIKSLDLLRDSWRVYAKNLPNFIMVFLYGLVGVIPMLVILLLFFIYNATGLAQAAPVFTNVVLGIVGGLLFLVSLYLAIVYSIRIKVASILLLKNNFTPAKDNFKESKSFVGKFLGVSVLTAVLVIAWGFLFIIPALIFGIYYGFATYILVVEGKRPFTSVERSYDLVKGYWWPSFGRMLVIMILCIIANMILSLPLSWSPDKSAFSIVYGIFTNIVWAVLSPYFVIYFYNLYKSLKYVNNKNK